MINGWMSGRNYPPYPSQRKEDDTTLDTDSHAQWAGGRFSRQV